MVNCEGTRLLRTGWRATGDPVVGESMTGTAVVASDGSPVCTVWFQPWDGTGTGIARHVAEIHNANLAGKRVTRALVPAVWYSDCEYAEEQGLRRPWAFVVESMPPRLVVDGQFGELVATAPSPAVLAYLMTIHNGSLLPVK